MSKTTICRSNVQNSMWMAGNHPSQGKCGYCAVCNHMLEQLAYLNVMCNKRSIDKGPFCKKHKCIYCDRQANNYGDGTCGRCKLCYVCGTINIKINRCPKHNCVVLGCPRIAHFGDYTMCIFHMYSPNCEYCCDKKYQWNKKFVCLKSHCLWLKKHNVGENQYRIGKKIVFHNPKKISNTHRRNAIAEHIADVLEEHGILRDIANIVAQYRIY